MVVLYIDLVQMPMQESRFWSNPYDYLILLHITFCIILPAWSIGLFFCCFAPTCSLSNSSGLEHWLVFLLFCSNSLFVHFFRLGAFPLFSAVLLQLALCPFLPVWSIPLILCCFAPTHSLSISSGLEHWLIFLLFYSNPLASCDCPIGGFSDISGFCSN